VVLERGLRGPLPEITPRCAIELEMLDRSEIAAYLDFHPGRQRRFVERRFAAGDACFTARHRGELLAVQWSCRSQHWVGDLHSTWCVGPGEVYLYDSYTHPQYRGQGVNPALCVHVLRHFGDLGLDRATLVVESGNASNLRSREKLGFERCGVIRSLSIGWGRPLQHRSHFAAPATTP
jgi:ribosomal protein S18 acetylase RimI-like enzyme